VLDISVNPIIYLPIRILNLAELEYVFLDDGYFCCYAKSSLVCDSKQQAKCANEIYQSKYMILYLISAGIIIILNIICIFQYICNRREALQYMSTLIPSMATSLYFISVYVAMKYYYDGIYAYSQKKWTASIPCYAVGGISISSILMSKCAVLQNALTHFLVVKYPFLKYMSLVDRYIFVFLICESSLSVVISVLFIWFYHNDSPLCLPWDHPDISVGFISVYTIILVVIPMCIILVTSILYYKIIEMIQLSVKRFGHKYTQVQKIRQKTYTVLLFNILACVLLSVNSLLGITFIPDDSSAALWTNLFALTFIACINTIILFFQH